MLLLEQQHWWAVNIDVRHGPGQGTKRSADGAGITDASDSKKLRSALEAAADTILRQDAELNQLRAEVARLKRPLEDARRADPADAQMWKDLAECTVAEMPDAGIVKDAAKEGRWSPIPMPNSI